MPTYLGTNGPTENIDEATDLRGPRGEQGEQGEPGQNGADSTVPGPQGPQGPPGNDGRDGAGICETLDVLSDRNSHQDLRTITLPADYADYDELYISVWDAQSSEMRANTITIDSLIDDTDYRIAGNADVHWTEATRTLDLVRGPQAEYQHVKLKRCQDTAEPPTITITPTVRGELIATSSYLPQNTPGSSTAPGSLHNQITWIQNSTTYAETATPQGGQYVGTDERNFVIPNGGPEPGVVHVPYRPPADNINGFWLVCEDMNNANQNIDVETWACFIPWGPGPVDISDNNFTGRHVLHFGIAPGETYTAGDDVLAYYYKPRRNNLQPEINFATYGGQLPSTQCRIKIYLAGVFIETE